MAGGEELVDSDRDINIDLCQFQSVLPAIHTGHYSTATALGMTLSACQPVRVLYLDYAVQQNIIS